MRAAAAKVVAHNQHFTVHTNEIEIWTWVAQRAIAHWQNYSAHQVLATQVDSFGPHQL
jgi:hypothetical protein